MLLRPDAGQPRKADDSANLPLLTKLDLRLLGGSWTTLNRLIDQEGFPRGRLIGRRRFWLLSEVMRWIEAQPSDKAKLRGCAKIKSRRAA